MLECHHRFSASVRASGASIQKQGPATSSGAGQLNLCADWDDSHLTLYYPHRQYIRGRSERSDARRRSIQDFQALGRHLVALLIGGELELELPAFAQLADPARLSALIWTKASLPPLSGVMTHKPFWALNHLTVPVVIRKPSCKQSELTCEPQVVELAFSG